MDDENLCPPGHRHDALCDPDLAIIRPPFEYDSLAGHREHMERANQAGWLAWQLTRPLKLESTEGPKVPRPRKPKRGSS